LSIPWFGALGFIGIVLAGLTAPGIVFGGVTFGIIAFWKSDFSCEVDFDGSCFGKGFGSGFAGT
jgi:hypothetical protein